MWQSKEKFDCSRCFAHDSDTSMLLTSTTAGKCIKQRRKPAFSENTTSQLVLTSLVTFIRKVTNTLVVHILRVFWILIRDTESCIQHKLYSPFLLGLMKSTREHIQDWITQFTGEWLQGYLPSSITMKHKDWLLSQSGSSTRPDPVYTVCPAG